MMIGMDDFERQTPHGDTEMLDKKTKAATDWWILCICLIGAAVITTCILVPVEHYRADPHYYVAIDSVSDLRPTEGLSFNLTLGVASRSYGSKACIRPGTYLEVSYHGVQLAASEAEVGWLCVGPRKSAGQQVAARATAVPVRPMLDRLMVDMNQGMAVFDIMLHLPAGSYAVGKGEDWMSGCNGGRVGDAAVWCDAPSNEPPF